MDRDILEREFPSSLIRSRKGPFGQTFSYVEGAEYIRRLNEAFEGEWSFEVLEHHIRDNEVFVLGRLTVGSVVKTAFGGSSITVSREGEVISIADDLKAAATDALKKASSLFGVGLHLYASEPATDTASNSQTKPATRPDSRGNGNSRGPKTGNGANKDRLTQKQLSALWGMGRALGLSADAIRQRSVQVFGVLPEQLTKTDASALITELGEALSSHGTAAGAP